MPYDPSTDAGRVRLLIGDTDDTQQTFTDAEITNFLDMEGDSVKLAAAQAMDTIADNEVLVAKVIRTTDTATDGAKVADSLRKRAQSLREQAAEEGDYGHAFEIVDFEYTTPFEYSYPWIS